MSKMINKENNANNLRARLNVDFTASVVPQTVQAFGFNGLELNLITVQFTLFPSHWDLNLERSHFACNWSPSLQELTGWSHCARASFADILSNPLLCQVACNAKQTFSSLINLGKLACLFLHNGNDCPIA